jgi:hypothetical protein
MKVWAKAGQGQATHGRETTKRESSRTGAGYRGKQEGCKRALEIRRRIYRNTSWTEEEETSSSARGRRWY